MSERQRDMGSYRMCMCFTRKFRYTSAEPPIDVKEAFSKYTGGGTHMTAEQLQRFLVEVQGEGDDGARVPDAERLLEQVLKSRRHLAKFTRTLTLDDFHYYLFNSDLNHPIINDKVLWSVWLLRN